MLIVHRMPTGATVKELYGTALVCAFPECDEPLFREKPRGADRSLNSRVAHIAARSEGDPRWDGSGGSTCLDAFPGGHDTAEEGSPVSRPPS
jgi:hypothetical protein